MNVAHTSPKRNFNHKTTSLIYPLPCVNCEIIHTHYTDAGYLGYCDDLGEVGFHQQFFLCCYCESENYIYQEIGDCEKDIPLAGMWNNEPLPLSEYDPDEIYGWKDEQGKGI